MQAAAEGSNRDSSRRESSLTLEPGTLVRAQRGDLEAFRRLIEVFERPIQRTVYRLVGYRHEFEVEDICQEIFLRVFKSLAQFDSTRGTKLSSWIFTFVKNYCFDVLKRRRLPTVSIDGGDAESGPIPIEDPVQSPLHQVEGRELQDIIADAVMQLPRDQRLAFVLREYEGLSYAEISEISETNEGTVKSRIHRAKEALRLRLQRLAEELG